MRLESGKGEAIAYGDATSEAVLDHVNLRAGGILANPDVHTPFNNDDVVYVLGAPDRIAAVTPLFHGNREVR